MACGSMQQWVCTCVLYSPSTVMSAWAKPWLTSPRLARAGPRTLPLSGNWWRPDIPKDGRRAVHLCLRRPAAPTVRAPDRVRQRKAAIDSRLGRDAKLPRRRHRHGSDGNDRFADIAQRRAMRFIRPSDRHDRSHAGYTGHAAEVSIERTRAWGRGERNTRANNLPGSAMSTVKRVAPVTLA